MIDKTAKGEKSGRKYNFDCVSRARYQFDISNRFGSDGARICIVFATRMLLGRKEIWKEKERKEREGELEEERHRTSLTGSRVIQKTQDYLAPSSTGFAVAEKPDFSIIHQEPSAGRHVAIDFLLISCGSLLGVNRTS